MLKTPEVTPPQRAPFRIKSFNDKHYKLAE